MNLLMADLLNAGDAYSLAKTVDDFIILHDGLVPRCRQSFLIFILKNHGNNNLYPQHTHSETNSSSLPYNKNLKALLSGKRKAGILCEVLFWQQVHKRKFYKIDFDRQRIIGNYIVDFYVKKLGLVIGIDG